jgi:hypothetical protein
LDPFHLSAEGGGQVFEAERQAVVVLQEMLDTNEGNLPQDLVDGASSAVADLTQADRLLASVQIQETEAAPTVNPANQQRVDEQLLLAHQHRDEGDLLASAGSPGAAIDHYRQAWEHALEAMRLQQLPPPPPQPLLLSPGFEEENSGEAWTGSDRGGRRIITTESAHGGARVAEVTAHELYIRQVYQVVGVTEGTSYHAAGWVKTQELQGEGASIRLVWRDAAEQVIHTDILGTLAGDNPWTRLEGHFVAPAGATTLWFNLYTGLGAGGTAWFDDNELSPD